MLAYRRISYSIFILMMLALFSLTPWKVAASVPNLSNGSVTDQYMVGVKPDTSETSKNLNNASKDKGKGKAPAEGYDVISDRQKKDARDFNDNATVQEIDKSGEGVSCADLGMVPDDETKGLHNYNILLNEVRKGKKINVNGTYYLQSPYRADSIDNEVDAGLFLIGISPDKSKFILMGGSFFNVKGVVLIEGITIECPISYSLSYLIRMTAPFVNEITIRNNYVTGNIRLIDSNVPLNFEFASSACYIEELTIEDNEFHDVYNSSGSRVIIRVEDTPVKSSHILNNKVTNFSYVFYNNAITNGHPSGNYLISSNNAVIENNEVVCTDDYDPLIRNGGFMSECYYCFAIIEGFKVECKNNTFEGFHVSDAPDTVVYDNYFSVTKLLYENNTWKNIVNFTPGIQYVDIMKSKSATRVAGEKTERTYRGNTYIVEPGYADRFGKDRFLLRKEINTYQTDIDRIIIEDNYYDMYILSFRGPRFKELYKFNGNTVLTDTSERSVTWQAFVYIQEMKDESGIFIPRNLIFTNNTITCESKPFGQAIGTGIHGFYLIYNNAGSGDKTMVDFSNNDIDVPGLGFVLSNKRPYSDIASFANVKNNIINGTELQSDLAKLPSNEVW